MTISGDSMFIDTDSAMLFGGGELAGLVPRLQLLLRYGRLEEGRLADANRNMQVIDVVVLVLVVLLMARHGKLRFNASTTAHSRRCFISSVWSDSYCQHQYQHRHE